MDEEKIKKLQEMVDESKKIVFFGGAGVSTESGVPDFRSTNGLYHQHYKYPPETILSHSFYEKNREEFFRFYYDKMLVEGVEPNKAHYKLAELEKAGKLTAVVTQNIDGLHQKAGSKNVYELHGSTLRNYCEKCGQFYGIDYMLEQKKKGNLNPRCDKCGGAIKPDVVLYEESLNMETIEKSVKAISDADMLIIGGTSLVVYPAAGLIDYFNGKHLVVINMQATGRDKGADLVIKEKIGEVLDNIKVSVIK
ncbi:MAG: NAD-dependent protein deacylase [Lachnospiraceae bacterium]|nr:MAG: NAD-dependent protein deacylase [Lachnospiraceae bacterium]